MRGRNTTSGSIVIPTSSRFVAIHPSSGSCSRSLLNSRRAEGQVVISKPIRLTSSRGHPPATQPASKNRLTDRRLPEDNGYSTGHNRIARCIGYEPDRQNRACRERVHPKPHTCGRRTVPKLSPDCLSRCPDLALHPPLSKAVERLD